MSRDINHFWFKRALVKLSFYALAWSQSSSVIAKIKPCREPAHRRAVSVFPASYCASARHLTVSRQL